MLLFVFISPVGRGTWRIGKDSGILENGRFCGNDHKYAIFLEWKKVLDSTKGQLSIPHFKLPFQRTWGAHDF